MIKPDLNKYTIKQIEDLCEGIDGLCSVRFDSFVYNKPKFKELWEALILEAALYDKPSFEDIRPPNVTMKGYESNPGIWIFDDSINNIKWLMFSDCHRKNRYRGTSYELICDPNISDEKLLTSATEFFKTIGFDLNLKEDLTNKTKKWKLW